MKKIVYYIGCFIIGIIAGIGINVGVDFWGKALKIDE